MTETCAHTHRALSTSCSGMLSPGPPVGWFFQGTCQIWRDPSIPNPAPLKYFTNSLIKMSVNDLSKQKFEQSVSFFDVQNYNLFKKNYSRSKKKGDHSESGMHSLVIPNALTEYIQFIPHDLFEIRTKFLSRRKMRILQLFLNIQISKIIDIVYKYWIIFYILALVF